MKELSVVDQNERLRILDRLAANLAEEPEAAFAYLYGSFGESAPFHDVDVGVYLRPGSEGPTTSRALALAQRLSVALRHSVDVRILNLAPVPFLYHVLCGQLILCRDENLLAEVMERTIARYLDIAPVLRHAAKEAFAACA